MDKFLFLPTPRKLPPQIPHGLYHYMREVDGSFTRFHLRVEPDGRGMLMANASAAARLSPVGVRMAKGLLDGETKDQILNETRQRFRGASPGAMVEDYHLIENLIISLSLPGDNYPIVNLEDPEISPFDIELMAPWQADLPLASPHETIAILDRLWEIGIPHVTIFVPPELDPDYLIQTIERAEDLGMIAGVRARATDLNVTGLLDDISMAGIDYITLLVASKTAMLHDSLAGVDDLAKVWPLFAAMLECEIAPVAELPLTRRTTAELEVTLERLLEAQVHNVNFVAYAIPDILAIEENEDFLPASSLPQVADMVEEMASELEVRFIWQPPVGGDPNISLGEQIVRGPRCSDDASIRVNANGDVIPPRGASQIAGNLLTDDWEKIWSNTSFVRYRERLERPTRCDECPGMAICAADCPRNVSGWSTSSGGYDR
jgi:radical SAM protein with 4Fe4S-binding SPASM domain